MARTLLALMGGLGSSTKVRVVVCRSFEYVFGVRKEIVG